MTLAIKSLSLFELICDYPYLESIQRPANYIFTGYSFVYADNMKVGCVVEEFDF